MKVLLITLFDIKGTVHFEFIPQGQIFNQTYYVETVKRLYEVVCRKVLNFGLTNDWILHHDNAPAHKMLSLSLKQFLVQNSIT
jgi:hypothetical protein